MSLAFVGSFRIIYITMRVFCLATYPRNSLNAKLICDRKLLCEVFNVEERAPLIRTF